MTKIKNPSKLRLLKWKINEKIFLKKGQTILAESTKNTIWVRSGHEDNKALIAHEKVHVEQMQKDGYILFKLKYAWYNWTKGYENNPYEIEAYKAGRP